jgi:hypothetical protein
MLVKMSAANSTGSCKGCMLWLRLGWIHMVTLARASGWGSHLKHLVLKVLACQGCVWLQRR